MPLALARLWASALRIQADDEEDSVVKLVESMIESLLPSLASEEITEETLSNDYTA